MKVYQTERHVIGLLITNISLSISTNRKLSKIVARLLIISAVGQEIINEYNILGVVDQRPSYHLDSQQTHSVLHEHAADYCYCY